MVWSTMIGWSGYGYVIFCRFCLLWLLLHDDVSSYSPLLQHQSNHIYPPINHKFRSHCLIQRLGSHHSTCLFPNPKYQIVTLAINVRNYWIWTFLQKQSFKYRNYWYHLNLFTFFQIHKFVRYKIHFFASSRHSTFKFWDFVFDVLMNYKNLLKVL